MAQPDRGERRRVRSQDWVESVGVTGQLLQDPGSDVYFLPQVPHGPHGARTLSARKRASCATRNHCGAHLWAVKEEAE